MLKKIVLVCLLFLPIISFAEVNQSVPYQIATIAKSYGFNVQQALYISWKESQWNCNAIGDHGESHGCWQIHLPDHPEINKEQAVNIIWSTHWAMQTMIKDGSCRQWSTCPLVVDD